MGRTPQARNSRTHLRPSSAQQRGVVIVLLLLGLVIGTGVYALNEYSRNASAPRRDIVTERALMQAKEALIAYATTHATLSAESPNGPGYFPCPDQDDDGDSDWNCGNYAGSTGQSRRLGRLPWKTLRLPDLRDSSGERLWYAVSSVYKNSTLKPGLNPDTGMGTITVRDSTGNIIHDGTLGEVSTDIYRAQAGGAVAVIIAPGPPVARYEAAGSAPGTIQDRSCSGGCDAEERCTTSPATLTAKCNPVNYLDKAVGMAFGDEDNANFVDVNIGRKENVNGFIQGPVYSDSRDLLVNDRIIIVTYDDIMQAMMQRVAAEAYHCLQEYTRNYVDAGNPPNLGRYPFAAPTCRSGLSGSTQWADGKGVLFGRFPGGRFERSNIASNGAMSESWTGGTAHSCAIGNSASSTWFDDWRSHVFFAVAPSRQPAIGMPHGCSADGCLQILDHKGNTLAENKQFAVLVSGPPLNTVTPAQQRTAVGKRSPLNYLEATNKILEGMNDLTAISECADMMTSGIHSMVCSPLSACNRITAGPRNETFNDLVMFFPP